MILIPYHIFNFIYGKLLCKFKVKVPTNLFIENISHILKTLNYFNWQAYTHMGFKIYWSSISL